MIGHPGILAGGILTALVTLLHASAPAAAAEDERTMLLKYTARCALGEGQFLESAVRGPGHRLGRRFPGALGLAPEWLQGTCGPDCQEKVSACLIALTNRTGKHVALSLLSGSPALGAAFRANADDAEFPHQEGAFFGNVFSGQAFTCRGRDADEAPEVKRFCAVAPQTCGGLADYRDAGRCEDVCQEECRTLPDGSERCAASVCQDPDGHLWRYPLTTYLRSRIEAGNADRVRGAKRHDGELDSLDRGDSARFDLVDFGRRARSRSTLVLRIAGRHGGGRIEVWLDGKRRLGAVQVRDTATGVPEEQAAPLVTRGITGRHTLLLKVAAGRDIGRLSTIELR
jgi:hypothetical protein